MHRTPHLIKFMSLSVMASPIVLGVGCLLTTDDIVAQASSTLQAFLTGLFGTAVSAVFAALFPG